MRLPAANHSSSTSLDNSGEHDIVCDPTTGDREDLERVQPMPAGGLRRVRGQRGLPRTGNCAAL
jgi:hypothetical protein